MSIRPTTKHDIQRDEENVTRQNFSVVTQINVTGTFLNIQYTGVDRGTGLVTILTSGTPAILDVANVFTQNQEIVTAVDPTLRLDEGNSGTSYFDIVDVSASTGALKKTTASGASIIDIDPIPSDGAGNSAFRFFRNVNTNGTVTITVYRGDGSGNLNHQLAGIGNSVLAFSSGDLGIGVSPSVKTHIQDFSNTNNAVVEVLRIEAIVSGTNPSTTGFGTGLTFYGETATNGTNQQIAKIETDWTTATNASRKGEMKLYATDTSARLGVTIGTDGAQALLGLYSASPVARGVVTGSRAGNAALASLLTVLNNLGAITNSSSA